MAILPDLSDLIIEQDNTTNDVMVTVRAASPMALYSCCGTLFERVQSRFKLIKRSMYGRAKLKLLAYFTLLRRNLMQEKQYLERKVDVYGSV